MTIQGWMNRCNSTAKTEMQYLITLLITLLSAPALALTPYTAVYEGKISGLSASMQMTLSPADPSGRIELRSVTKARGLSRLIKRDPIVEYTQFEEIDGRFRPIEYHYLFNNSGSKRNAWIIFDTKNLVASSLFKAETVYLDIQSGHVDPILEQLLVRRDLMAGSVADKYLYIQRNTLREAVYEKIGTETLRTKAGDFDTIKYRRQRVGSTRSVIIWFAPELEYLPIQMQHFKQDNLTGTATLKHYAANKSN